MIQFLTADAEARACDAAVTVLMPHIDAAAAQRSATLMEARAGCPVSIWCIEDRARDGFVACINRHAARVQSPYLAYVAQDAFAGRYWLRQALQALERNQGTLLGFNDGKWAGLLAAFGLLRLDWARAQYAGAVFHPGYRAHYADAELTLLAMEEGRYRYEANSVLVEVDWSKDGKPTDAQDRALFAARRAQGFDGRVRNPRLLSLFA